MSRKDYVRIAALVRDLGDTLSDPTQATDIAMRDFIGELANMLKEDNPNFDKQRFYEACGVS